MSPESGAQLGERDWETTRDGEGGAWTEGKAGPSWRLLWSLAMTKIARVPIWPLGRAKGGPAVPHPKLRHVKTISPRTRLLCWGLPRAGS